MENNTRDRVDVDQDGKDVKRVPSSSSSSLTHLSKMEPTNACPAPSTPTIITSRTLTEALPLLPPPPLLLLPPLPPSSLLVLVISLLGGAGQWVMAWAATAEAPKCAHFESKPELLRPEDDEDEEDGDDNDNAGWERAVEWARAGASGRGGIENKWAKMCEKEPYKESKRE